MFAVWTLRFDSPFTCECWALGPRCVHRSYADLLQQGRCQPTCYTNVINYVNGSAVGIDDVRFSLYIIFIYIFGNTSNLHVNYTKSII